MTGELLPIHAQLEAMHAWRGWVWQPGTDPFEIVVGAILVQNTAWTNVERALANLRAAAALSFEAMDALGAEELEQLVYPSGQFRQKARKLRAFLDLAKAHGGFDGLIALPGPVLTNSTTYADDASKWNFAWAVHAGMFTLSSVSLSFPNSTASAYITNS